MYDSREKAALDIASNLLDARQEGRQEGRHEGKLAGKVQTYQELLGEQVTEDEVLLSKSEVELVEMIASLQIRLRTRNT